MAPGTWRLLPVMADDVTAREQEQWRGEVVRLSWKPRAYVLKRFLTDAEADHIINLVRGSRSKGAGWVM